MHHKTRQIALYLPLLLLAVTTAKAQFDIEDSHTTANLLAPPPGRGPIPDPGLGAPPARPLPRRPRPAGRADPRRRRPGLLPVGQRLELEQRRRHIAQAERRHHGSH